MLIRWGDFDSTLSAMDVFRQRMDRLFDDFEIDYGIGTAGYWPRMNVYDEDGSLMIRAEVPGLAEKDITIDLHQNTLTISGERISDAPAGYAIHRQERPFLKFSRSVALPFDVDPEKCNATLKNGILTLLMPKSAAVKPRKIKIRGE